LKVYQLGIQPGFASMTCFHALARLEEEAVVVVSPLEPYVSVGYFQNREQVMDEVKCRELGLPVIRRKVGGGTVLLDMNQIFYHVILRRDNPLLPLSVEERYRKFSQAPINTYRRLGVPVRFKPVNDILTESGRKISGEGGANIGHCAVFTGSIILDFDVETMVKILRVPDEKFRDKIQKTLAGNISTLKQELGQVPLRAEIEKVLIQEWETLFGPLEPGILTEEILAEMAQVEKELTSEAFWESSPQRAWPPLKIKAGTYVGQGNFKAIGGLITVMIILDGERLAEVEFSGDFSLEPKEGLRDLNQALTGLDIQPGSIENALQQVIEGKKLDLPGVCAADLAQAVINALPANKE